MSALKKTVTATVIAVISFSAFADSSPDGREYEVLGFLSNARAVQNNLLQSKTGYNNSCGPTSMLFVSNFYGWKLGGPTVSVNMDSVAQSRITIQGMYNSMSLPNNSITDLDGLNIFAKGVWGWTRMARMDGTGKTETATNINNLISTLTQDILAVVPLKATYAGNSLHAKHIVVVYRYSKEIDEYGRAWNASNNTRNLDQICWFEPYYGYTGCVLRKDAEIAFEAYHFSFLKAGR